MFFTRPQRWLSGLNCHRGHRLAHSSLQLETLESRTLLDSSVPSLYVAVNWSTPESTIPVLQQTSPNSTPLSSAIPSSILLSSSSTPKATGSIAWTLQTASSFSINLPSDDGYQYVMNVSYSPDFQAAISPCLLSINWTGSIATFSVVPADSPTQEVGPFGIVPSAAPAGEGKSVGIPNPPAYSADCSAAPAFTSSNLNQSTLIVSLSRQAVTSTDQTSWTGSPPPPAWAVSFSLRPQVAESGNTTFFSQAAMVQADPLTMRDDRLATQPGFALTGGWTGLIIRVPGSSGVELHPQMSPEATNVFGESTPDDPHITVAAAELPLETWNVSSQSLVVPAEFSINAMAEESPIQNRDVQVISAPQMQMNALNAIFESGDFFEANAASTSQAATPLVNWQEMVALNGMMPLGNENPAHDRFSWLPVAIAGAILSVSIKQFQEDNQTQIRERMQNSTL